MKGHFRIFNKINCPYLTIKGRGTHVITLHNPYFIFLNYPVLKIIYYPFAVTLSSFIIYFLQSFLPSFCFFDHNHFSLWCRWLLREKMLKIGLSRPWLGWTNSQLWELGSRSGNSSFPDHPRWGNRFPTVWSRKLEFPDRGQLGKLRFLDLGQLGKPSFPNCPGSEKFGFRDNKQSGNLGFLITYPNIYS